MKIFVYRLRDDERVYFDRYSEKYGIEFDSSPDNPSPDNVDLAKGCQAINIATTPVDRALIDRFYELGIRCIMTRTIGRDHIDCAYAKEKGMEVLSITYSPDTVAEFAVMMILMGLRKVKYIRLRNMVQDYSLNGKISRELGNLTVGIVGTGRIGASLARMLTGFGCRILAYDPFPKAELTDIVEYTDLDTLLRESDVLSLHAPAVESSYHMIDGPAFAKMKAGAGLVNCARGPLVDTDALIDAIESGHLGFACLDTIENEYGIYYHDRMGEVVGNRQLAILNSFPNVINTPHVAFYTEEAVSDMVENSFIGLSDFFTTNRSNT